MQAKRESFYRCVFTSPSARHVAHVRAWDSDEAMQLFRLELKTDGLRERGTFEVVRLSGSDHKAGPELASSPG
jgi:hypothetical protein